MFQHTINSLLNTVMIKVLQAGILRNKIIEAQTKKCAAA